MAIRNLDNAIRFGTQNFFFCNAYETDPTYDYFVSMTNKGTMLISRFTKSGSNDIGRYWLGIGTYPNNAVECAAKGTYVLPNELVLQLI
jgi:hypothetical protein